MVSKAQPTAPQVKELATVVSLIKIHIHSTLAESASAAAGGCKHSCMDSQQKGSA